MIRTYILISNIILFIAFAIMFSPIKWIEPDFKNRYNDYMFIINSNCDDKQYKHPYKFVMKYADIVKDGQAGLSTYITGLIFDTSTIKIDRSEWNSYNEAERTSLIFHELTHALLNYRDLYEDEYKNHFMYYRVTDIESEMEIKRQLQALASILCKK